MRGMHGRAGVRVPIGEGRGGGLDGKRQVGGKRRERVGGVSKKRDEGARESGDVG